MSAPHVGGGERSEPVGGDPTADQPDAPSRVSSPAARAVDVVLVDDHALVREGLRSVLGHFDDIRVVDDADNADAAIKAVTTHEPDVVVLDLQLHDEDGAQIIRALTARGLAPAILVLSVHEEPERVRDVLRAGARGYLLKSVRPDDLAAGIRRVAAGGWSIGDHFIPMLVDAFIAAVPLGVPPVTPREHEVLDLLADGLANREVAERLGISTRTAQKHVENLFKKFNVHGRGALLGVAARTGLLASTVNDDRTSPFRGGPARGSRSQVPRGDDGRRAGSRRDSRNQAPRSNGGETSE